MKTKTTEEWILEQLKTIQKDLHDLFMGDVATMDLKLYNEITLAITTAEIEIQEAITRHNARKALANYREDI